MTFLVLACITCETSGRLSCRAGDNPKKTPVRIARATLNAQHRQIDPDGGFMREGEFRQQSDDQRHRPIRQQHAERSAS